MHFQIRLAGVVACASLLAASIPALSQTVPLSRAEQIAQASKPLFGWPALVREARKYMGTNPTARSRLWCATFMNMVLNNVGYSGTQSDAAKSFAQYGRRISEPQVGAIAVLTRGKNGGHVGVVTGVDENGNPVIISGNHNKRVGQAIYPRSRVIAYVMPADAPAPITQLAARRNPAREAPRASPPAEKGLVGPITELLAAIEAEQTRAERAARLVRRAQRVQTRAVQPTPQARPASRPVPHRVVQQAPDQQSRARDVPLDPALAEFLGLRDRAPRRPPGQRG